MPDHVHLLVEGESSESDCRRFMTSAKRYSGFHHAAEFNERLWQRYCYEHVLREQECTLYVARYIVENPIRAGLVTRVEDYPFLGSAVFTLEELLEGVTLRSD
jgi:putative transposase